MIDEEKLKRDIQKSVDSVIEDYLMILDHKWIDFEFYIHELIPDPIEYIITKK